MFFPIEQSNLDCNCLSQLVSICINLYQLVTANLSSNYSSSSGSKTFHNERYEHRRQALYDKQKQSLIDKIQVLSLQTCLGFQISFQCTFDPIILLQTRMSKDLVEKREKRKVTKDQLKGLGI